MKKLDERKRKKEMDFVQKFLFLIMITFLIVDKLYCYNDTNVTNFQDTSNGTIAKTNSTNINNRNNVDRKFDHSRIMVSS